MNRKEKKKKEFFSHLLMANVDNFVHHNHPNNVKHHHISLKTKILIKKKCEI
jgi:hypothetical protein